MKIFYLILCLFMSPIMASAPEAPVAPDAPPAPTFDESAPMPPMEITSINVSEFKKLPKFSNLEFSINGNWRSTGSNEFNAWVTSVNGEIPFGTKIRIQDEKDKQQEFTVKEGLFTYSFEKLMGVKPEVTADQPSAEPKKGASEKDTIAIKVKSLLEKVRTTDKTQFKANYEALLGAYNTLKNLNLSATELQVYKINTNEIDKLLNQLQKEYRDLTKAQFILDLGVKSSRVDQIKNFESSEDIKFYDSLNSLNDLYDKFPKDSKFGEKEVKQIEKIRNFLKNFEKERNDLAEKIAKEEKSKKTGTQDINAIIKQIKENITADVFKKNIVDIKSAADKKDLIKKFNDIEKKLKEFAIDPQAFSNELKGQSLENWLQTQYPKVFAVKQKHNALVLTGIKKVINEPIYSKTTTLSAEEKQTIKYYINSLIGYTPTRTLSSGKIVPTGDPVLGKIDADLYLDENKYKEFKDKLKLWAKNQEDRIGGKSTKGTEKTDIENIESWIKAVEQETEKPLAIDSKSTTVITVQNGAQVSTLSNALEMLESIGKSR